MVHFRLVLASNIQLLLWNEFSESSLVRVGTIFIIIKVVIVAYRLIVRCDEARRVPRTGLGQVWDGCETGLGKTWNETGRGSWAGLGQMA